MPQATSAFSNARFTSALESGSDLPFSWEMCQASFSASTQIRSTSLKSNSQRCETGVALHPEKAALAAATVWSICSVDERAAPCKSSGPWRNSPRRDGPASRVESSLLPRSSSGLRCSSFQTYHPTNASSNMLANSFSPAGRGDSLVTRCCGRVPSTKAGISSRV